jgi:protoporphyrinogen oxidase
LINELLYPIYDPGLIGKSFQERACERGSAVELNAAVIRVNHDGRRIRSLVTCSDGVEREVTGESFTNGMPITQLIARLDPSPPDEVLQAANSLSYRDFIVVALILDRDHMLPDNWIYIQSPEVKVGRIQNFKNRSPAVIPDARKTCLGMEYFCTQNDPLWSMRDDALIALATEELLKIGLAEASDVKDGIVIRQHMACPVHATTHKRHLAVLRRYLATFENLQVVRAPSSAA